MSAAAVLARALSRPRARAAAIALGVGGAALVAATPGSLASGAARAALAVAAVGALAALARRARPAAAPALAVVARQPLGKDSGVALLEVEGRRVVVGWGTSGVRVLRTGADEVTP